MVNDWLQYEIEDFFDVFDMKLTDDSAPADKQAVLKTPNVILDALWKYLKNDLAVKSVPPDAYPFIYQMLKKFKWSVSGTYRDWYNSLKVPNTSTNLSTPVSVDDLLQTRPPRDSVQDGITTRFFKKEPREQSSWIVYINEVPSLEVTFSNVVGRNINSEKFWADFTSTEYREELLKSVRKNGLKETQTQTRGTLLENKSYEINDMKSLIQALRRLERMSPNTPEYVKLETEINSARDRIKGAAVYDRIYKMAIKASEDVFADNILTLELNFEHEATLLGIIILKQLFPEEDIINQDYIVHLRNIIMTIADAGKLHRELVSVISDILLQKNKVGTSSKGQEEAEKMLIDASRYDEIVNQLFGGADEQKAL